MVAVGDLFCPECGFELKYYDSVYRNVKIEYGKTVIVHIRRLRCKKCQSMHRELPSYILPYKQYRSDIIIGAINGVIANNTLEYEDHPCEQTVKRWKAFPPKLFLHNANSNLE